MRPALRWRATLPAVCLAATIPATLPASMTKVPVATLSAAAGSRPTSPWLLGNELLAMLQRNPCLSDDLVATRLARFPEGLALIRMRADLDAAERLETARLARENRAAGGQLVTLRNALDSMVVHVERLSEARSRAAVSERRNVEQQLAINSRVRGLASAVDSVVQITLLRAEDMTNVAPAGYLGVTLSSVPVRQALRTGYVVSYCAYPVVEAVDPGSPAERAGVRAGDTLVAFNGRDVLEHVVDYTALLVPGETVRMAVRRSGRRTELPLRVDARPEPVPFRITARLERTGDNAEVRVSGQRRSAQTASVQWLPGVARSTNDVETRVFVFEGPGAVFRTDSVTGFFVRRDSLATTVPAAAPRAPRRGAVAVGLPTRSSDSMWAALWPEPMPAMMRFAPSSDVVLAGAKLQSLGAELRASLALPEGVLVLEVLRGTPAFDSGLRAGDVIRRAGAGAVRTVDDVRDALVAASGSRTLTLQVVDSRAGEERTVRLRW